MDDNAMMLFQNTQSVETVKSATTKEHSKVKNFYNFTVSFWISKENVFIGEKERKKPVWEAHRGQTEVASGMQSLGW